jgi:ribosomal protein L44E
LKELREPSTPKELKFFQTTTQKSKTYFKNKRSSKRNLAGRDRRRRKSIIKTSKPSEPKTQTTKPNKKSNLKRKCKFCKSAWKI